MDTETDADHKCSFAHVTHTSRAGHPSSQFHTSRGLDVSLVSDGQRSLFLFKQMRNMPHPSRDPNPTTILPLSCIVGAPPSPYPTAQTLVCFGRCLSSRKEEYSCVGALNEEFTITFTEFKSLHGDGVRFDHNVLSYVILRNRTDHLVHVHRRYAGSRTLGGQHVT